MFFWLPCSQPIRVRKTSCIRFRITRGIFSDFSCLPFSTASSAAPKITLCLLMLDMNPGLLHHSHWQPDALTTRLDLIHWFKNTSINILFRLVFGHLYLCFKNNDFVILSSFYLCYSPPIFSFYLMPCQFLDQYFSFLRTESWGQDSHYRLNINIFKGTVSPDKIGIEEHPWIGPDLYIHPKIG